MQHVRPTSSSSSFFAPARNTSYSTTTRHTHRHSLAPPLPDSEAKDIDPETRRWLADYPKDADLVPLIADLKVGKENPDFLLSEVGLLYLRPEGNEVALLVPPRGVVRWEILEDAHLGELGDGDGGGGAEGGGQGHVVVERMMQVLSETFWWDGMRGDVETFVKTCRHCQAGPSSRGTDAVRPQQVDTADGYGGLDVQVDEDEDDVSLGGKRMTELPTALTGYTGLDTGWEGMKTGHTGGESAMAVEMAVAMRKAKEDAEGS